MDPPTDASTSLPLQLSADQQQQKVLQHQLVEIFAGSPGRVVRAAVLLAQTTLDKLPQLRFEQQPPVRSRSRPRDRVGAAFRWSHMRGMFFSCRWRQLSAQRYPLPTTSVPVSLNSPVI